MRIKILSTSDVHGHLFPTNFKQKHANLPLGYAKAGQIIQNIRQQASDDEIVLYIENGDFIEGSPLTDYIHRTSTTKHKNSILATTVNQIHPDAGVLGNHEFNYGLKYLANTWQTRNFPILNANISGTEAADIGDGPYTIFERRGIKIAILGLTTQFVPHWEVAEKLGHLRFSSAVETAKYWVPLLKKRADIVIVAYHGGFERDLHTGQPTETLTGENEGYALLQQVQGIDALVTGHQHREIATLIHGVPVTQPGYRGSNVGQITLTLDKHKQVTNSATALISTQNTTPYPATIKLIHPLQNQVEQWLDQPLATINGNMEIHDSMDARLHGHAYLSFINHIQMQATGTDIAATALFNDEITGLNHHVTIRDVLNSYIYPNTLVVETISGADLKKALERCASFFTRSIDGNISVADEFARPKLQLFNYDYYSGINYTFDLAQPYGQRVVDLVYHNKPVTPQQNLNITLNQYRGIGAGEYHMFSPDKIIRSYEDDMQKLIIEYLNHHPMITPEQPHNLKIKE